MERCKKGLHIVLCFSPIGESLRKRILAFPSLVNCTTIDWFSAWPADALQSVADNFLKDVEMDDEVRNSCCEMVQLFHTTTADQAAKFLTELKRHYYVTPTSYLELITTFKTLLSSRRAKVKQNRDRYANGYDTLIDTETKVGDMRIVLEDMQPKLVVKAEEVGKETIIVEKEASEAEVIATAVGKDEAVAQKQADAADAIASECKEALEEAMPALRAAEEALKNINKGDITLIKSVNSPTLDTLMVMSAVCVLMHVDPIKKMNPETQKKEVQYWKPVQGLMNGPNFLKDLLGYDKEAIDLKTINQLKPFVEQPNFNREKLLTVSTVVANIGSWCLAMFKFYHVNLIVVPKKEQLKKA